VQSITLVLANRLGKVGQNAIAFLTCADRVRLGVRILFLFLFPRFGCADLWMLDWGNRLRYPQAIALRNAADVAFRYQKKSLLARHFYADGELRKIK
jgi:hypothetical protein